MSFQTFIVYQRLFIFPIHNIHELVDNLFHGSRMLYSEDCCENAQHYQ